MQNPHIFANIAQFIDISNFKDIDTLRLTCKSAKNVCDIFAKPYTSDLIYVEHSANGWNFYRVEDLAKNNINLSSPWPFINDTRSRGLAYCIGYDTSCGFVMNRKELLLAKAYDSKCSCSECEMNVYKSN